MDFVVGIGNSNTTSFALVLDPRRNIRFRASERSSENDAALELRRFFLSVGCGRFLSRDVLVVGHFLVVF